MVYRVGCVTGDTYGIQFEGQPAGLLAEARNNGTHLHFILPGKLAVVSHIAILAHENQEFPLMPAHPNYEMPPFLTCTPRKRREITAVIEMIKEQVMPNLVAGATEAYPFIHWVTYTRIGCGCGQDHHVTYELDIVPAAHQAIPGMTEI